ncbi:MAG: chorismate-binding protein [Acidimicrobiia bacterium]|nr:chorismate-binding protein [Acidimicrobiia bacterium]
MLAHVGHLDPLAVVGSRCFTGLRDVTSDLSALDSSGFWVVALSFEGDVACARFDGAGPVPQGWPAWEGPARDQWRSSLDRDTFGKGVVAVREAIAAGDVYEVNLCRVLSAPAPRGADIAALGGVLRAGHPAPFGATVRVPGVDLVSASPELFLRRNGAVVESRPIKGTAGSGQGFSSKDRAENVMIVDLVRNDLGRVCEYGSVEVPALCAVEQHPGLDHLVSTVRGRMRAGVGWAELLDATFPPGSVTGAPKLAALDTIRMLEPVRRGPYCGAVGWVDADRRSGELNVAIRTFWLEEGMLHFGTGGALTWGSTPDGEWAETELKASRLLAMASATSATGGTPS